MNQQKQTKGQLEADITAGFTQFEREHMGRGPKEARTFVLQDMILVRLKGILTPAERTLAAETDGILSIKQIRSRLIESSRDIIAALVLEKTGAAMISMHTDLSVPTGERIFVIVVDRNLEEQLR